MILFSSFIVFLTGILVIVFMKSSQEGVTNKNAALLPNIKTVLKIQSVWLIMFIIISAYVGYKVTDIYSLYASDVMNFNNLEAANIGSLQMYLRPLVCLLIALFSDKKSYVHIIIIGFIIMLIGALIFFIWNRSSRHELCVFLFLNCGRYRKPMLFVLYTFLLCKKGVFHSY